MVTTTKSGLRRLSATKPRIVVCDEAAKTRQAIIAIIGPGYDCVGVSSAEEVLAEAAHGMDLLLTEVSLAEIDGIDLCRQVRNAPGLANTPIILLTGVINDDTRALGYEAGADDYLNKPIRPRELRARVASLLKLRFASRSLEARSLELENANLYLSQAQEALVQAERLAIIGTLVAGVAHEINNPVAFIKSGTHSILACLDDIATALPKAAHDESARKEIEAAVTESRQIAVEIGDGARRLQRICQDLKAIASEQPSELESVDLVNELNMAWKMAAPRAEVKLELTVESAPAQLPLGHLFGQVVVNLFLNAAQAMVGPGTIWCNVVTIGDAVSVIIRDSGPGIPPKILSRIFDPFFTTKASGGGTGLGLAVSQSLMRKLGGSLEVSSPPGSGAVFTLVIPLRRSEYRAHRAGKVA